MPKCIFCLEEKSKLTDEHVIYAALGSDIVLPNSSCKACQEKCNKSFEQRFLKGSNFVGLIRAQLGIRGRRNKPIFGFDKHGAPITVIVQPGFPPIRVGLSKNGVQRPMQIVLADEKVQPISYHFFSKHVAAPNHQQNL